MLFKTLKTTKWSASVMVVSFSICWPILQAIAQDPRPVYLSPEEVTREKLIDMFTPPFKEPVQRNSCEALKSAAQGKEPRPIGAAIPAIPMPYNRSTPDAESQHV